jgi:Glycosyltransferases involved in cell wall biogenesis
MVSVIIPVYNGELYIKDSMLSVINQEYKDIEIIIVNDGSTDNTLNIAESIWEKYSPKGKIITIDNGGLANARNVGIEASKGDYICNLDADDYLESSIFQDIFNHTKGNFDVCYYGFRDVDENGNAITDYEERFNYIDHVSGLDAAKLKLKKDIWICQGSAVYKKDVMNRNGIKNVKGVNQGEDLYFITSMLASSDVVRCVAETGVNIRSISTSMMHCSYNNTFLQSICAVKNLRNRMACNDEIHKDDDLMNLISIQFMEEICCVAKRMIRSKYKSCFKLLKEMDCLYTDEFDNIDSLKHLMRREKIIEYSIFKFNKFVYFCFVKIMDWFR